MQRNRKFRAHGSKASIVAKKKQSNQRQNPHLLTAVVAVVAIVAIVVIWNGGGAALNGVGAALVLPEQAQAEGAAGTPAAERAQADAPSAAAQARGKVPPSRTFVTQGVHTTGGITQIVFDSDETGHTIITEVTTPNGMKKGTVCMGGACR